MHAPRSDPAVARAVLDDEARAGRRAPRRRSGAVLAFSAAVLLTVGAGAAVAPVRDDIRRAVQLVAADEPIAPRDATVLADLWRAYEEDYVDPATGRTVDHQADGITTSEGQSYTMMRAVWMDDRQTFDAGWQWTKDNLQRRDGLMAWKFGERPDGSYGILRRVGGGNSATDADVDIAFALLMGYSRWKDDDLLYDALPVITAIWEKAVVRVDGRLVLAADDLQRLDRERVIVNPSYLAPYAYRVFAQVDEEHDWSALVDSSYALLEDLQDRPLDAGATAGLPPDWVSIDRRTGGYGAVGPEQTTRFGYEALRLPWRLALDHRWYGEERARALLEAQGELTRTWTADHRLAAVYGRDGMPAVDYESPAMYGGAIGHFAVTDPTLAEEVYTEELLPVYDVDRRDVAGDLGYYESNWVWFGMALHLDQLPNLNVSQE